MKFMILKLKDKIPNFEEEFIIYDANIIDLDRASSESSKSEDSDDLGDETLRYPKGNQVKHDSKDISNLRSRRSHSQLTML